MVTENAPNRRLGGLAHMLVCCPMAMAGVYVMFS